MRVVSRGSFRKLEIKDERTRSARTTRRVTWDKGKRVGEDLQVLRPKPSLATNTMAEVICYGKDSSKVDRFSGSPCGSLDLKSSKDLTMGDGSPSKLLLG